MQEDMMNDMNMNGMEEVQDLELQAIDGGSLLGDAFYALGYIYGAWVKASVDCGCDPSLGMT